jgi:hypothetical protein
MKLSSTTKTIGIMVLIATYISYPFFKIKYFETLTSLKLIYHNLLLPIIFFSAVGTIFANVKYLRQLNPKTNSKVKVVFQDLFTTVFLTGIISAILVGMTVSTIVTTNAYCGQSKDILVIGTVLDYSENTTKWGRLRHRIKFISSYDNKMKDFEVYRKYELGEEFRKEMKIGLWGQLYSID